jgi:hypothetical protein
MLPPSDATAAALWRRALPEERVLFCCMRQELDAAGRDQIVAAAGGARIDWDAVLRVAVQHQVAPLVLTNLGRCAEVIAQVPPAVRAKFHHQTLQNMQA